MNALMLSRWRGIYAVTPDEPETARLLAKAARVLAARPALP